MPLHEVDAMSKTIQFKLLGMAAVAALLLFAQVENSSTATSTTTVSQDVDLGIGDESRGRPNIRADAEQFNYNRPAILIAWRNTAQVLEVEVLVTNLGVDQGKGQVHVEVVDEYGKTLARMPPNGAVVPVTVPARDDGGKEGSLVQIGGSKALNALIDRLDRDREKYYIKAVVTTVGEDKNPYDNYKVKSYNRDFRARPGSVHFFDYFFTNLSDQPQKIRWYLDMSPLPKGWEMEARPAPGYVLTLAPNQSIQGNVLVRTPREIIEGDRIEMRMSGIDENNQIVTQTEWHLVHDNDPPEIISPSITATDDGGIDVEVTVNDILSGIYEASGVKSEYSTDKGATYSTRVISYVYGSFVNPTLFKTTLGPFAPDAVVQVTLSAMDIAGNIERTEPVMIKIPGKIDKQAMAQ
jgi:hypothetical protein